MSDTPMAPADRPGQLLALWTNPHAAQERARKAVRPVILAAVVTVMFVVFAIIGQHWALWVVAALAVLALALTVLLVNHRAVAKLRGDDLIDLVVMPDHLLTAGALRLDWNEISTVQIVTHDPINLKDYPRGDRLGMAIAARAFQDGLDHLEVKLLLPDAKAVLARTSTKIQKAQIIDDIGAKTGETQISLAERSKPQREEALRIIAEQADRHGVPVEIVKGAATA